MAVSETGDVYVWGRAKEGQLGNGEVKGAPKPVRVAALRHERVIGGACGYYHCLAFTAGGKLYQWGKLHKHEGVSKEYFGMAIGLSGLQSERAKRMIDRSHNAYYAAGTASDQDTEELSRLQNFGTFVPYVQPVPELVPFPQSVRVCHRCCCDDVVRMLVVNVDHVRN